MANGENRLESIQLPSLPYVSHEILLEVNQPEADMARLVASLGQDPALSARVVSAANTAFFLGRGEVRSLDAATMRLGVNRIRVLSASILLHNRFDPRRCPGFDAARYWQHSIATAGAAGGLAQEAGLESAPARLGGLLHSIGLLLLAHGFPAEMERVFAAHRQTPDARLGSLVRGELEFDHYQAGAMLLREWELPDTLCGLVEQLGSTAAYRAPGMLAVLRGAADWAAEGFGPPPEVLLDYGPGEAALERLGAQCRREQESNEALARLLAGGQ